MSGPLAIFSIDRGAKIELEVSCTLCDGIGCQACEGRGTHITEEGEAILELLFKYAEIGDVEED